MNTSASSLAHWRTSTSAIATDGRCPAFRAVHRRSSSKRFLSQPRKQRRGAETDAHLDGTAFRSVDRLDGLTRQRQR